MMVGDNDEVAATTPEAESSGGNSNDVSVTVNEIGSGAVDDLTLVRELILEAHRDVIPELIAGGTIEQLLASIPPARDAFSRVSERLASNQPSHPTATMPIPAGSHVRTPAINADHLSPATKIRMGLGSGT
jgi:hypothetical protein